MTIQSFSNDYNTGCHPRILDALAATNNVPQAAYGQDDYSEQARELLRKQMNQSDAAVHFVSGGTQANLIVVSSALRRHEAIISAESGHINSREGGAIEAVGNKIIQMPTPDGKLTPAIIEDALADNSRAPQMAKPKMVYVTNVTELGTVYTKAELSAISRTCHDHDLILFLDGARLATALVAERNDLELSDIAELTDLFWFGGTKAGALIGEAIIITREDLAHEFDFAVKQRGAYLAKGRLLGLQFRELMKDGLVYEIARHANAMALKLADAFTRCGFDFAQRPEANILFPVLPQDMVTDLARDYAFLAAGDHGDGRTAIRLLTSWATEEDDVDRLIARIEQHALTEASHP